MKRSVFKVILAVIAVIAMLFLMGWVVFHKPSHTPGLSRDMNLQDEMDCLIQEIIDGKNKAILEMNSSVIRTYYDPTYLYSLWAYEHEIHKMNYLHQWAEKQSVSFQKMESDVVVRWVREKSENEYTVDMMVSTAYTYAYHGERHTANSFKVGTYHSMDLLYKDELWIITKDWYTDTLEGSMDPDQINDDIRRVIMTGEPRDKTELEDKRLSAIAYADQYCGAAGLPEYGYQYNPDYMNFNHLGGDCANFASQVLYEAGGFSKNSVWNYAGNSGSKAWVNAQSFKNYILHSGRGTLLSSGSYEKVLESSYQLLPGDIIAYGDSKEVRHISVVTGADSKGYTLVNCHNSDRYRVPWDLGWSDGTIRFWLIRMNY